MSEDVRRIAGSKYTITADRSAPDLTYFRTWLGARLLWDPDQDYNALINEFVSGYYESYAPYINKYIELNHLPLAGSSSNFGFSLVWPMLRMPTRPT